MDAHAWHVTVRVIYEGDPTPHIMEFTITASSSGDACAQAETRVYERVGRMVKSARITSVRR